ncbi:DJ-1/PfpI family protein [Acrocarpospora catenulata]|uniref:DJ-1/PfpI family protein n=1 Tax=Acrocarpospora catenulata TaxID=2836182 RepID=UPI001BD9ADA6|nr:DJ-1/PfpI family protein [Acrocarpospora catenulata]
MWRRVLTVAVAVFAAIATPVAGAAVAIRDAVAQVYPAPGPGALPSGYPTREPHLDPSRPTVAIVLGAEGGNVADALAPYEVFARTGRFNVVTVAPIAAPVPLTGGLDIVPDFTFGTLAKRLPHAPEVIVVPQINGDTTAVVAWLTRQHQAGAPLIMSVCVGAGVLADTGLLAHRRATSHWLGLIGLRRSHPEVDWVTGERFVDDGDLITTAGVLSGIDGSLRVIERTIGPRMANDVADQIHWNGYRSGMSTAIPAAVPQPADLVGLLNAGYRWDRPTIGILLTDGVGEIELAAAFRPYTELSYLATLRAVTHNGRPIKSRHGLTFVPRSGWAAAGPGVDRLLVPGAQAAATKAANTLPGAHDVTYLHRAQGDEFPFDGTLRDIARFYDTATATWVAKTLQYPTPRLDQATSRWPWAPTARITLLAAGGAGLALIIQALLRRRRATVATPPIPTGFVK